MMPINLKLLAIAIGCLISSRALSSFSYRDDISTRTSDIAFGLAVVLGFAAMFFGGLSPIVD